MDRMNQQWSIREGADVIGSDDHKVGEVVAVHSEYIIVEKGFFFPTDYYIPSRAVATYDGNKVYLNVTKDEALHQGWDELPAEDTVSAATGYTTDIGATDVTVPTTATTGQWSQTDQRIDDDVARRTADDTLRVPVHEEELTATTRPREVGEVVVEKDVITEEQTLDVPVTEERVRVERRIVDREAGPDESAWVDDQGTIRVPVTGEEIDVQKRTRVREEIEISKEPVQRTEQVTDTVRREEVRVDESGNVVDQPPIDADLPEDARNP
jgi:uncharacterized protein (TIGR02271 family)